MSAILDSVLDEERLRDIARNEPANDGSGPLRHFWVRTDRNADFFPVMGRDRVSVQKQHEGICREGEQCLVLTPKEHAARVCGDIYDQNSRAYWKALEFQQQRLACEGRL